MREIVYRLYGLCFRIMNVFPVKKNKALFFMIHDCKFQGNLRFVYEEWGRQCPEGERVVLSKKQMLSKEGRKGPKSLVRRVCGLIQFAVEVPYHWATAEYVFLNDNFLPMCVMPVPDEKKVYQLFHGAGAFKRFGLDTEPDPFVRKYVSVGNKRQVRYICTTAEHIVPIYSSAFGVDSGRIDPNGIPLMDFYFDENEKKKAKRTLYRKHPEFQGKKLLLYAPTFRTDPAENDRLMVRFDAERLLRELGDDYCLAVRFHPQKPPRMQELPKGCVNVTSYFDVRGLYVASETLITDYSCSAVEYALLRKPVYLYAYDLDSFDRGFAWNYRGMPGGIASDMDELISQLKSPERGMANADYILKEHFDCPKGGVSERLVRQIEEERNERHER